MRFRVTLILLLINLVYTANAQFQASNWPLVQGKPAPRVLKILPNVFNIDTLSTFSGLPGYIACSSISTPAGNLLAFSYGDDIKNRTGSLMENGCCLSNISCVQNNPNLQGCIFLPKPGSSTQYYLFIKDNGLPPPYCRPIRVTATLFDMSYNNGLGKVLERAVPILEDTLSDSRMTACKHANGRDWWLINHEYNTNRIYTHLITPDSIYGPFSQYIGGAVSRMDWYGWSLFSQSGDVYITSTVGMQSITLLSFDRCTGTFSNYRSIPIDSTHNVCFLALSPNGQYLYAANQGNIWQYDLHAADIANSIVELIHYPDPAGYFLNSMVLMPDGKIYQANWFCCGDCISVIDSPNLKAPACGYHLRTVCIPGGGIYIVFLISLITT